jgi:hypothetical protein
MAITTYSELKSSVADWLNRDDLTSVIPDFITLSEAQYNRSIRHRNMIVRSRASIDARYSATPPDWIQTVQLILLTNPVQPLNFITNEEINKRRAASSAVGRPNSFTHVGTEIAVYPAPDSTYEGELVYYGKIPALSDSNTTNWLLDLSPDIYLYGSLIQATPYLRDDERLPMISSLYQRMIEDMNISNERTSGQTSTQMRVPTFG